MVKKFLYGAEGISWALEVDTDTNKVTVTCLGETREYQLREGKIVGTEQLELAHYVTVTFEDGMYYQFKFEHDAFLVGDIFSGHGEFLNEYACHVFGMAHNIH